MFFAYNGEISNAVASYRKALQLDNQAGLRIRLATLLPPIPPESITVIRQALNDALDALEQDENLCLADPVFAVRDAFFYLAYHGCNNRAIKIRLARLLERCCPALLWQAPHCATPRPNEQTMRIGIISKYLYDHSIGKTTQGLVAKLPRNRFRVYVIFVAPVIDDAISRFIGDNADEVLIIPASLEIARQQIAALALDILFYQDIGMDPFTYYLAYARLARMQCTSFGHPETTGIRNLDYYVSTNFFETATAQTHYSETLYLLENCCFPSYYYAPVRPAVPKTRAEFGLQAEDHIYLCPQSLFKFHPGFDEILGAILQADPDGKLVLLAGPVANFAVLLLQRFQESFPDLTKRVRFLPQQTALDFINLLAVADVMLDIPYFNGMNSNLEAFAVGTPVVTLPGELQCTRHCAAMYRKMGISDCIAQDGADYIRLALRLANDSLFRREVSAKIKANQQLLFEDEQAIVAFSDFFEQRIAAMCAAAKS